MSKQLFANEKVMTQYLGALLCEDAPEENLHPVAKLLEQVVPAEAVKPVSDQAIAAHSRASAVDVIPQDALASESPEVLSSKQVTHSSHDDTPHSAPASAPSAEHVLASQSKSEYFDGQFQALFFEVAGLTLAVPLKALGGIHELGEVNHLFGKPKWFKGVMLNRDEKLNVVDTARWVMPEKYDAQLEASLDYKYLITLGDSQWGLLAEKLINNITLQEEDVKWRTNQSKRPWLAGVIKEKMCALIDVNNLNALLEKGLDSR
ncbi:chemotaxis protein CheW [Pseudoalteromonas sp.]|uniref:chemotaxis protein CheW n=1 Tax=Pseudoalteromonas sp. TaxID=53249 RepID=UPI00356B3D03